jgi:hypothetical protein
VTWHHRTVITSAPPSAGWIHQSYSLHELKRTIEARNQLLIVAKKFAGISTVAYHLACFGRH